MNLTLKTGHNYRTRGGDVVHIIGQLPMERGSFYEGSNGEHYYMTGYCRPNCEKTPYDIVEELTETKPDKVNILLEALKEISKGYIDSQCGWWENADGEMNATPPNEIARTAIKKWSEE